MANPQREVGAERQITMKDYALRTIGNTTSCIVLGDTSRNYELKSIHFNMLPSFYGMPSEDALTFIREFYVIVHTFPLSGLNEDQLRMRMERNEKKTDSIEASLKRLEAQMEQIVEELNKEELSSQPEQANSITTIRRGTLKNDGLVQSNEESIQKEEKVEPDLRLEKKEKEAFSGPEFHKMLSKVNTNLPLLDVIRNKPAYAKFFEELNTNKRRYANNEKVQVANVMLQHQLPLKMKDPGSFTINITIGDKKDTKVVLDLGASINLMPYSMYELLGLGELKPTTMSLQFVDRSIKYPRGIVEDLLVQVGKLIIPVDFVVLNMENTPTMDKEQTILFGRPFMATTRTVIDMHDEKLTMIVLGETVEFKVFDFLTLSPKSAIDKCSYNYLDSLVYDNYMMIFHS
ncbi:uncharacterized protein LOC125370041 [Ricinus communis]|uniref:uncharacterized protein LOC125370041 n=1 Tax=Ricinus communis TaxID=3988 RepID=UPI00201A5305|nr:uncharacterized protein LOC125370041 [Ricinus communis]